MAAAVLFVLTDLAASTHALSVSEYTVTDEEIDEGIRIVELADLHNSTFGDGNERLVKKVAQQEPDLIVIAGDLIDSSEDDTGVATELITALCEVAPVYISPGNHEKEYEERCGTDLAALYEAAGDGAAYACTVLDFAYTDIEVNGQTIRLGGLYGYCVPEKYEGEAREDETTFLKDMQDTELYTVLLCHMPVCWTINEGLEEWEIDCVLTGHAHGGQVILPGIGGLWAPDMGWFPGKLTGTMYSADGEHVLVYSRGLGNTDAIPRLNNIPEIVVVDLMSGS